MKRLSLILLLLMAGCSRYTQAQVDLVNQARRGVVLVKESQASHRQWIDAAQQSMRTRLDEAFDADIRERQDITPEWMLEHRRAYSAAVEMLDRQRVASARADEIEKSNLEAIDRALAKLGELQAIQSKVSKKVEGQP